MIEKLQHRFSRKKVCNDAIEDVYDGKLYKEFFRPGAFLSHPHNISFLGNTDGVALIWSTNCGVWPVYLVINELPPWERFRRSNRIFAGLWFGKGKPHFPTFPKPFSLAIRDLGTKATSGHAGVRIHDEMKQQSLEALRKRSEGKKDFSVQGVIGLSWGFGIPSYDVVRETAVDYMHCICEGVVDQLISQWLKKSNTKADFYLGSKIEDISKELLSITPTCEITRTPRSLEDIKDWKGKQFQTFNVHQLLHLSEVVEDLGPLWSNSCFPFEDYSGDLRDLFHGTQNVDGQIVTAVSIIQKLPEIARSTTTSPSVTAFYEHLTRKGHRTCSKKERISGSLERVWSNSKLLSKEQLNSLPNNSGKIWLFRRFLIGGTLFHSASYRRVVAGNDYTVEFEMNGVKNFGTIQIYVKVEDKCFRLRCRDGQKCFCELACSYFALIETLVEDDQQLPMFGNNVVVNHIRKVNPSNRYTAYNRVRLQRSFLERLL
ncbi:Hypothetical predicted protein [Paramuricea clavata]|uniref:Uncharacterized protein n=1 Tax=Paramuricea clavata TaxID=317549 RepID=A0A6S7KP27_PARCT|nr:Hypothetical predicted protein [Paramuricea clavata]